MEPIPFPAWRYHVSGRTCIVEGPAQDVALKKSEAGWGDKPLPPPPNPPDPPAFGATDHAPVVVEAPVEAEIPVAVLEEDLPPDPEPEAAPEPESPTNGKRSHHRKR